jgi:hypothetical protein
MMTFIQNFGRFWYDFIVGDDKTIAIGVVITMALTAILTANHINAWWLMLLGGAFVPLTLSVYRAAER